MESEASVIIAGNWKMYKTNIEAVDFIRKLGEKIAPTKAHVLLAVPFTAIAPAAKEAEGSLIEIGAQNMNDASEGAFTGEVAAKMLVDAGAKFVILGHSERRRYFNEDDAFINRKVRRALREGLKAILCVGETLSDRESGKTEETLRSQLAACLDGVEAREVDRLIIAYEPVWAIGTGINATAQAVEATHLSIRLILASLYNEEIAKKIPVIYGGSVKPANASAYIDEPNIDGLLVGGASLDLDTFDQIVNYQHHANT